MAQTEGKKRPMSKEKRRFLRKIIIFFLVIATPVLTALCIFLGIRLHIVRGELKRLQAQAVEASVFYQAEGSDGAETPNGTGGTGTDDMAESDGEPIPVPRNTRTDIPRMVSVFPNVTVQVHRQPIWKKEPFRKMEPSARCTLPLMTGLAAIHPGFWTSLQNMMSRRLFL